MSDAIRSAAASGAARIDRIASCKLRLNNLADSGDSAIASSIIFPASSHFDCLSNSLNAAASKLEPSAFFDTCGGDATSWPRLSGSDAPATVIPIPKRILLISVPQLIAVIGLQAICVLNYGNFWGQSEDRKCDPVRYQGERQSETCQPGECFWMDHFLDNPTRESVSEELQSAPRLPARVTNSQTVRERTQISRPRSDLPVEIEATCYQSCRYLIAVFRY